MAHMKYVYQEVPHSGFTNAVQVWHSIVTRHSPEAQIHVVDNSGINDKVVLLASFQETAEDKSAIAAERIRSDSLKEGTGVLDRNAEGDFRFGYGSNL